MDLKTKLIIINKLSKEYKKANKKQKGKILTELIRLNGYNRSYARRVLRKPVFKVRQLRFKKSKYIDILPQLKKLWIVSNFACVKILVPAVPELLKQLVKFKERVRGVGPLTFTLEK